MIEILSALVMPHLENYHHQVLLSSWIVSSRKFDCFHETLGIDFNQRYLTWDFFLKDIAKMTFFSFRGTAWFIKVSSRSHFSFGELRELACNANFASFSNPLLSPSRSDKVARHPYHSLPLSDRSD